MAPVLPQLSMNPQLPQHPLGQYTDAEYEAQDAIQRAETTRRYNAVLRKLGFLDPETGQHIMGDIELDASQQSRDLERQQTLARQAVTENMQRSGTLFSGYRAKSQAQAEEPFVQGLANISERLPRDLASAYDEAMGLLSEYTLHRNLNLVDAARRRAASLATPTVAEGPPGGGTDPPPAGPSPDVPGPRPTAASSRPGPIEAYSGPAAWANAHPAPKPKPPAPKPPVLRWGF